MAKIENGKLLLSKEEQDLIGEGKEFDIIPNQKGIYLLIEKTLEEEKGGTQVCVQVPEKKIDELAEEKEKIVGIINKGKLSELVEGKFEKSLKENELKALRELKKEERVIVFKLNETYKKGVYKINPDFKLGEEKKKKENKKKTTEDYNAKEKEYENYNLDEDGILIVKNQTLVRQISSEMEKEIKDGMIRGLKSFDGFYYIIENELLVHYLEKTIEAFRKKTTQSIDELAKNINISKILVKVVCEFLKDEGEIIEKKKGEYSYIN
jgi:hypothetical protein